MRVLIVGGGGREHAIAAKLKQSPLVTELYCAPGNAGIAQIATCVDIGATDVEKMVRFAADKKMDFVCVTPDDPLALGMVDALEEAGIPAFGPNRAAAQIEASKAFSKDLMQKYHIPTAQYRVFDNPQDAKAYLAKAQAPIVVKADGLAKGKGVIIAKTIQEAEEAVDSMLSGQAFGAAGSRVVIEEALSGPEVSMMCFSDGKTLVPMISSQDHKRVFDNDEGPNTGGMGAFAPTPTYTPELHQKVLDTILLPTLRAMAAEGRPFKGVLYAGLMLTEKGPMTLEFNARFGDPETQAVLPLLKSDLMEIMIACRNGTLDKCAVEWYDGASAVIVMASGGYPGKFEKGKRISGLENVRDALVVHAGTREENGNFYTDGGRVLGVCARGETLAQALKKAYAGVSCISFENAHFRHDIGKKAAGEAQA